MNYILADLESTEAYLKAFADAHTENPFFIFGTTEDVMTASRGDDDFAYPVLWLDLPQIDTKDNDMANLMETYGFSITALYKAESDSKITRTQAYQKSIKLLQDLQKKLRKDNKAGIIVCELSGMKKIPLNPQIFNDSHIGYILFFEASFHANQILN